MRTLESQGFDEADFELLTQTMAKVLGAVSGPDLTAELAGLGWFEMWTEQPREAAMALFGQQGRLALTSPLLSRLMAQHMADGNETTCAVLLPRSQDFDFGDSCTPDPDDSINAIAQLDALDRGGDVLITVAGEHTSRLCVVPVDALTWTPIAGLDPAMRLAKVDAASALADATNLATGVDAQRRWADGLALGRLLLAQEMVGVVTEQLRLSIEHAQSRVQFGRSIGSFQAVAHKLADVHVALTVAGLACQEAWTDLTPTTCMLAKMLAGAAVEAANLHCQQVLAGIGFTWEHPFHRYARRGRMLTTLLGSRTQLAAALGNEIRCSGTLPVLAAL